MLSTESKELQLTMRAAAKPIESDDQEFGSGRAPVFRLKEMG